MRCLCALLALLGLAAGCGRVRFQPADTGPEGPDAGLDARATSDAFVGVDAHFTETLDASMPDAPRVDATVDAFAPPDAPTSGRCADPRAELTSEGCVIPSATACTPFSPCPTGYSCAATAMGDRCRCDDQALCGPRCSPLVPCADTRFPVSYKCILVYLCTGECTKFHNCHRGFFYSVGQ